MNFIHSFEEQVADYCRRKDFDGAICGHIHVAEMREIDGIVYMNDGDWVESCTALAEHHDGKWELLHHKPKHIRKKKPSKKQQLVEIDEPCKSARQDFLAFCVIPIGLPVYYSDA